MSKKSRRDRGRLDPSRFDLPESVPADDELDFGFDDLSGDLDADEWWWDQPESGERISTRRKIERRHERRALHAELNDWDVRPGRRG